MLDIFYIATCYLPYFFLLLVATLLLPAIVFFPSLTSSPLLASTIPVISAFVVCVIAALLFYFGIYTHEVVIVITIILCVIAIIRFYFYYQKQLFVWQRKHVYLLLINVAILLPMLAFNGLSTFMTDNALIHYHFWAMHYYSGVAPDTDGFPPLFSLLISYWYKLLDTSEYQGPVKALLCVFPFTTMNIVAFASSRTNRSLLLYLILISIAVFPGFLTFSFYKFYTTGNVEPMWAAAIVASLALLFLYQENKQQKSYLWLAVFCGITASLTKQPALLWVFFSLPVFFAWQFICNKKIEMAECLAVIIGLLPALLWLIVYAPHFYNNPTAVTVVNASLSSNHVTSFAMLKTFLGSVYTYFIKQPTLLLVFVLAAIASFKKSYKAIIFLVFIIPTLLVWFILGSYDIRAGINLLAVCGLLIATENYFSEVLEAHSNWIKKVSNLTAFHLRTISFALLGVGFVLFFVASINQQKNSHIGIPDRIYPLNAGLSNLYRYFGSGADFVYQNIYLKPQVKIWVSSGYIVSLFYPREQMIQSPMADIKSVYQTLRHDQPDYIFTSGRLAPSSYAGVSELITHCPKLFTEISLGETYYGYRLYKVNKLFLRPNEGCAGVL